MPPILVPGSRARGLLLAYAGRGHHPRPAASRRSPPAYCRSRPRAARAPRSEAEVDTRAGTGGVVRAWPLKLGRGVWYGSEVVTHTHEDPRRGFETRLRDALLDAMIPAPGRALPAMASVDRSRFWPRFGASAPVPLRAGFRVATWVLGVLAPLALGHARVFTQLDLAERDDLLRRAGRVPGAASLLQLVKLVACFAYFDDAAVQAAVRQAPPDELPRDEGPR